MTSSATKNDEFTLPHIEKMALRGTLRELLTRYTETNENRGLSIAIRFDKAKKDTGAKSTVTNGLSAPEECAVNYRPEFFALEPLRRVDEEDDNDKLAQMKKGACNSSSSPLDRFFSTTLSTYVSFPLYLPGEEPFEFCGSSFDSTCSTITLFDKQASSKPPQPSIGRDGDVYPMHSTRSRKLSTSEKYTMEIDKKNFATEVAQHQQKIGSKKASKSDLTLRSTVTSLNSEIEQEEDVEEYAGKEANVKGGRLDKEAFTQGESAQIATADNGGVDGDDSRAGTLEVRFPMEK